MLEKAYDSSKFEIDTYEKWEKLNVFAPRFYKDYSGTHINILPPPNANGALHLGHASGYTIMDIAGRYARMKGKETLLIPGKDHAGILTQVVFERELKDKGINREDLGREEFYKQCYDFCIESAETMRSQEKRIGLSADWNREKFTLDPEISKEVLETFVKMHKDGLAYKGTRIINWCPYCQTALSDMEVDNKDTNGSIWELRYPIKGEENSFITVETTRPETMLGDTAVAVHPEDKRYTKFIGKKVLLPIMEREIPIISDAEVDMSFGSGAVKITPAHDPLDYAIGKRNNLPEIQVIGFDGKMTELAGKEFEGETTHAARKLVVEKFEKLDLLGKEKKHTIPLSLHDRCSKVIEPLISDQWWINTDHEKFSLKKEAIKAVKSGKIRIVPEFFNKTFYNWMENLEDWCVSRQIWWSQRIPAYYCQDCNNMDVSVGEKTEIYYMRHGQTDMNKEGKIQGTSDIPLNNEGRSQAKSAIKKVKDINPDVIISSPLIRAKETAEIIAKDLGKDVIIEKDIFERDFGEIEGVEMSEVLKKYNVESWDEISFNNFSDAEKIEDVKKRLKSVFDSIEKKYQGKKVLLVAHGWIVRVLRIIEKQMTETHSNAIPMKNAHIEKFTRYSEVSECSKCKSKNIKQDEDTFDTWFSSGQWAHNTLHPFGEGEYFPSDFMVMGRDILFFWAARMIMMSLYTTGEVPFKTLYLTGLINDRHGKKMSKSKGNGIDPLEMANKYGTDALRLSLFIGASPGNDMRLYEEKIEGYRNFVNKLWNASRFVQMSIQHPTDANKDVSYDEKSLSDADKWMFSRLNNLIIETTQAIDSYRYSEAGQKLYDFTWNEFCDWYLELSKGEKQNISVLREVLKNLLILLHPFIPFVTEVLWKELGFIDKNSVMLIEEKWPQKNSIWQYEKEEKNIEQLIDIITTIRSLRSSYNIEAAKKILVVIVLSKKIQSIENHKSEIVKLAHLCDLMIVSSESEYREKSQDKDECITKVFSKDIEILIPLSGAIDKKAEKKRLEKEREILKNKLENLDRRLSNESYTKKAPKHLVEETTKQRDEVNVEIKKIEEKISRL